MFGNPDVKQFNSGTGCGYVVPSHSTIWSKEEIDKTKNEYTNNDRLTNPEFHNIQSKYYNYPITSVTSTLYENINFNPSKEGKYEYNELNKMNLGRHGKFDSYKEGNWRNTRIIDQVADLQLAESGEMKEVKKCCHKLQRRKMA